MKSNDVYKVHLFKNRKEWLDYRVKGIGGSDASACLGKNPYKTNVELWNQKSRSLHHGSYQEEEPFNMEAMQYGIDAEPLLRKLFELKFPNMKVYHQENCILQSVSNPHELYSPDGLLIDELGRKGVLEIKTANVFATMHKEKWGSYNREMRAYEERIPENYYIQVLHGLNVTEFDYVYVIAELMSVRNDKPYSEIVNFKIERCDVEEDLKYLRSRLNDFWQSIVDGKEPNLLLNYNL
jgi:putative phage-type endonuclease